MLDKELTGLVLKCAFKVHSNLGPGLLESVYQHCLAYEMSRAGLAIEMERPLPVIYEGVKLNCGYRLDLVVENRLILEIKSVDGLAPIHFAQVLTYLKISGFELGLLLNFNVESMKNGIRRIVNNYQESR